MEDISPPRKRALDRVLPGTVTDFPSSLVSKIYNIYNVLWCASQDKTANIYVIEIAI